LDAQFKRIRELTSGQLAEMELSRHLLLPPPSWIVNPPPLHSEENPPPSLLGTLLPTTSSALFRIDPKQSIILAETGTVGNANDRVDAGEWVRLSIAIESLSPQPAYSTSAWVSSRSPCTWVKERDEIVLDEFRGEPSLVGVWLYVSNDCPQGKPIQLTIDVEDSWLNAEHPVSLDFGLMVASVPTVAGVVPRIDGDTPGWSMEQGQHRFDVDSQYELRVDVNMYGTETAEMEHVLPTLAGGISVVPDSYVASPMIRSGNTFAASDDLDFTTPSMQQGTKWLNAMNRGWASNPDPRAVFAADVFSLTRTSNGETKREYSFRQEFLLPFTMEAPRIVPPPPPPRPVAVTAPPKPPPPPPPSYQPKKSASTVLGFGATMVNVMETKTVWVEDDFSDGLVEEEDDRSPRAHLYPSVHLHYGQRIRGQVDAFFGGMADDKTIFEITAGPRVNVVHMEQLQLGAVSGAGVRVIQVGLEADLQVVYKGGVATDVFLTPGFALWLQVSTASRTPDGEAVGGEEAYSVMPQQIAFGMAGLF
jgi:hypothetical protein